MSTSPRLRILSVGGNAVSAFLSWRLQATNACDVTLVWKSGFEAVSQYGISFKSKLYGNERFKPRAVVRSPEEASGPPGFDYVLLCVKALPDVYDLAAIIESVVTPQLTCIIVNTTSSLGVEPYLESRFPTNVVLSLCSGASITQIGPSEFEHVEFSEVWVGSANPNPNIPTTVQGDMAEALSLTLQSGNVQCHVSTNIRQQQWDKMIGPIAFHPLSVLTDTPNHSTLLDKAGMKSLVNELIDELMNIAKAQGCRFSNGFKQQTMDSMQQPGLAQSTMYQDFSARRPMEVEIFLGSALKMAQETGILCPHIQTLYPLLSNLNIANQSRPPTPPPALVSPARQNQLPVPSTQPPNGVRLMAHGPPVMNGRPQPGYKGPPVGPPNGRRMPPNSGQRGPSAGQGPRAGFGQPSRRNSFDNDLEEFGHIAMYGDMLHTDDTDDLVLADAGQPNGHHGGGRMNTESLSIRERELFLKQKELELREKELALQQGSKGGRRKNNHRAVYDEDEDDDDDDYSIPPGPTGPPIDPDNIDMMSVTSRRTRRLPSNSNLRGAAVDRPVMSNRNSYGPSFQNKNRQNRTSSRLISEFPTLHDTITNDPLMAYSSNRYGGVDRKALADNSRANSLTAQRMEDIRGDTSYGGTPGPYPPPNNRRTSFNPADNRSSSHPNGNRSSFAPPNMPPQQPNGRLNIPHQNGASLRQPQPKYPGGYVVPQVEQQMQNGVSHAHLKDSNDAVRNLTGSASASANSGDSGTSANIDLDNAVYSSTSSLERKVAHSGRVGVRV